MTSSLGFDKMKFASTAESQAEVLVYWDMNEFPAPHDVDPCQVRPCIKRLLESRGYYGALSITAFGVLSDVPTDILRGVYHSGVDINNIAKGHWTMGETLIVVIDERRHPANIIAISEKDPGLFCVYESIEFNILQPFPCADDFQTFLKEAAIPYVASEKETCGEYAYWDCFACARDPPAHGFENFTMHLSSEEHIELTSEWLAKDNSDPVFPLVPLYSEEECRTPPLPLIDSHPLLHPSDLFSENDLTPMQKHPWDLFCENYLTPMQSESPPEVDMKAVTSVFWDLIQCPLPPGFDPCLAGPRIRQHLLVLGYSGPLTIAAVGLLTEVPDDVLRGLYSGGVRLTYVLEGSKDIRNLIYEFTWSVPAPANIMLIANPGSALYCFNPPLEYNFLLQSSFEDCLVGHAPKGEHKWSETREWVCTVCSPDHVSQGFENLTTHLSSRAHERKMLDLVPWNVRVSKRQPLNAPPDHGHESVTVRT